MPTAPENPPAFPFGTISELTGQPINECFSPGATLRDVFAWQAMTGLLAYPGDNLEGFTPEAQYNDAATKAYAVADSMLRARQPQPIAKEKA